MKTVYVIMKKIFTVDKGVITEVCGVRRKYYDATVYAKDLQKSANLYSLDNKVVVDVIPTNMI